MIELKYRQCPHCNRGVLQTEQIGGAFEDGRLSRRYVTWTCARCGRSDMGYVRVIDLRQKDNG